LTSHKVKRRWAWRGTTLLVATAAGALVITTGLNSHGLDLRAASITDLATVVRQERARTDGLQSQVTSLNRQVGNLTKQVDDKTVNRLQAQVATLAGPAQIEPVVGSGVTVTLNDAPKEYRDQFIRHGTLSGDELVVHQQDIQAVANALWTGGAEAMTIQGQRVVSTTGIKCVGNTVVLHGVPYSPPYRISAIGDQASLHQALDNSAYVSAYRVLTQFHLGYDVRDSDLLDMPGYTGALTLRYATAVPAPKQPR
jgi:uncharacterized protein YlxW (UPF0749 family)